MLASGALPEWTIDTSTAVALAVAVATLMGAFVAQPVSLRVAGIVAGLIAAPASVLLSTYWLSLRDRPLKIELILAVTLGALPGILLFAVVFVVHERRKLP